MGTKPVVANWEFRARATSAAPFYFKPFTHEITKLVYQDGAIHHNNPVVVANQERRLIWPDEPCEFPDLILSLGTGTSPELEREGGDAQEKYQRFRGLWNNIYHLAKDHFELALDCNHAWNNFVNSQLSSWGTRFKRVNPMLPDGVPALDDVAKMKSIQEAVRSKYDQGGPESKYLEQIAKQLVAACFYFKLSGPITKEGNAFGRMTELSSERFD